MKYTKRIPNLLTGYESIIAVSYQQGISVAQLAKTFKVSKSTIQLCLHKQQIELKRAVKLIHGEARNGSVSPEYKAWSAMKARCYNSNLPDYGNWGGRGILVCSRWLQSFENFLADMGRRPSSAHSLDRIDVNGHYEPSNCKWATKKEQANNVRNRQVLEKFSDAELISEITRRNLKITETDRNQNE